MTDIFQKGKTVRSEIAGTECTVGRFLGGGGQGEVYEATWNGRSYALKWYFPEFATEDQRKSLCKLLKDHRAPSEQFLWPLDLCVSRDVPGFGYLMRLREPRFKGLLDLVTNKMQPSFCALVTAGLGFADNFFKLHMQGLCYRDLN